ncbi:neural cell adhesion molecule 2-like [Culicoides brevitarsis]|uniref:neural cell adhesion molecule 2-like n=1 Tax=Culicoides brevitarsis TaxID=469753 RepID=UPI00307CC36E
MNILNNTTSMMTRLVSSTTSHLLMTLHLFAWIFLLSNNVGLGHAVTQVLQHKEEPRFISQSAAFKFAVGDTIILPCEVTQPGGTFLRAWKRGIAILTASDVKVTPDPRVRLIPNRYTLQINNASPADGGDYICQLATIEPREITHHVEILVPPKIEHVTSGGHLQVRKGSPVRLECSAKGNPMPNITWTRKNNLLPNGEEKYVNTVYTIENMDRHKGGIYICTASNGVGQTASSQINLHVLYPPEINVESPVVYSGEGQEAVLVCIVHGESQPEVTWYKDTMQIDQTERYTLESRGARNTLLIRRVHAQDFGNYSCVADNQLGKTRKMITLTGKPRAGIFRSTPLSQWKDKYNISWTVDSYAPIEEYRLFYKMVDDLGGETNKHLVDTHYFDKNTGATNYLGVKQSSTGFNFNALDIHDKHDYNNPYGSVGGISSSGYSGYSSNTYGSLSRTDWRDIVLPAIPFSHHYTQGMSYFIRGLEPDQQYEAKVQSRNRYGWSDFSERFVFSTSHTDTEILGLGVTHYGSSSSDSIIFSSNSSATNTIMKYFIVVIISLINLILFRSSDSIIV